VKILLVNLKVTGNLFDTGGKESNLNLGRTGITRFSLKATDNFPLSIEIKHRTSFRDAKKS
jgi:hypothetical protein